MRTIVTFETGLFWHDVAGRMSHFRLTVGNVCAETGISRSAFYRLKNSQVEMTISVMCAICEFLEMNPARYFMYEVFPSENE